MASRATKAAGSAEADRACHSDNGSKVAVLTAGDGHDHIAPDQREQDECQDQRTDRADPARQVGQQENRRRQIVQDPRREDLRPRQVRAPRHPDRADDRQPQEVDGGHRNPGPAGRGGNDAHCRNDGPGERPEEEQEPKRKDLEPVRKERCGGNHQRVRAARNRVHDGRASGPGNQPRQQSFGGRAGRNIGKVVKRRGPCPRRTTVRIARHHVRRTARARLYGVRLAAHRAPHRPRVKPKERHRDRPRECGCQQQMESQMSGQRGGDRIDRSGHTSAFRCARRPMRTRT